MELTFNLDDDLATRFVANKSKEKLNTMFKNWVKSQLANENSDEDSPLEFIGMWKNKDIDPVAYAKELRKGRKFDVN